MPIRFPSPVRGGLFRGIGCGRAGRGRTHGARRRWYTGIAMDGPRLRRCGVRNLMSHRRRVPALALRRFRTMLAHYHGQTWNAAEPARAIGVRQPATRHSRDLLTVKRAKGNTAERGIPVRRGSFMSRHAISRLAISRHRLDRSWPTMYFSPTPHFTLNVPTGRGYRGSTDARCICHRRPGR